MYTEKPQKEKKMKRKYMNKDTCIAKKKKSY